MPNGVIVKEYSLRLGGDSWDFENNRSTYSIKHPYEEDLVDPVSQIAIWSQSSLSRLLCSGVSPISARD